MIKRNREDLTFNVNFLGWVQQNNMYLRRIVMEYGVFKLTQKTYCQSLQGKIPIPIAPKEILMSTPQKRNVDLIPF